MKFKELYPKDYQNVKNILKGKDANSVEFEKIAINWAKEKNVSLAEAKSFLNIIYAYKAFAELVGAARAGTALNYVSTKLPKGANANEKLLVVGETKGYNTTKVNLNNLEIEISKQNKHLENTNEYKVSLANGQQKSLITVSLDSLKGYVGTGQQVGKTEIGLPGSKERVNFNKNIGIYIDPVTGNQTPTTMGIIHYSKNGYHVVPAKPKE